MNTNRRPLTPYKHPEDEYIVRLARLNAQDGSPLTHDQVVAWARELAGAVHTEGDQSMTAMIETVDGVADQDEVEADGYISPVFAQEARPDDVCGRCFEPLIESALAPCQCQDPGCPVHPGAECDRMGATLLRRIDMDPADEGLSFCSECARDALESGVFAPAEPVERP